MSMDDDRSEAGHEDSLLVAEFALGLLSAGEHERMARRIAAEPALRAELRMWNQRLAGLDAQFEEQAPPSHVFSRVEQRIFATRTAGGGWWNSLALWRSVAMGSLAVAVVAIGVNVMRPAPVDPEQFATQLVAALQSQEERR